MGTKKELTVAQRGTIIYCSKRGDSYRKIAETVGCSISTVSATLKRHKETSSYASRKRSGRPPVFGASDRQGLKRLITRKNTTNHRLSTAGVRDLWRKKAKRKVSSRTIGRVLRSFGLRNCRAKRKPLISPAN